MTDPEQTDTNWQSRWARNWAEGRAWALANPKAARAILLGVIVVVAFVAGAVIF